MSFKILVLLFGCAASTNFATSQYLSHPARNIQYPAQLDQRDTQNLQQQQFLNRRRTQQPEYEYEEAPANTRAPGPVHKSSPTTPRQQFEPEYATATNAASTRPPSHARAVNPHEKFSSKLLGIVGPPNTKNNIVFSPIAMQMLLAFIYTGAEGNTALEMQSGAVLPKDKTRASLQYKKILDSSVSSAYVQLTIANKLFYNDKLQLSENANNYARLYFDSELERTEFHNSGLAAERINSWVAKNTQNQIQRIVSADSISPSDSAVLINVIHLKAKWDKEFSIANTHRQDFYLNSHEKVGANMMFNEDSFRYADFPSLQAQVVELQYRDSELTMLVILPNSRNGLADLEQRLQNEDLSELTSQLRLETVELRLPKFTIEFDVDMVEPLKRLGIQELFSNQADLSSLFPGKQQAKVSKVQQRVYIDVNEAGSEAAAVSFAKLIPLSLPPRIVKFTADHPFVFAIRSPQAVYFVGHVAKIRS